MPKRKNKQKTKRRPESMIEKVGHGFLSDLFYKANVLSSFNILTFINADIILPGNFLKSVKIVDKQVSNFLSSNILY